MAVKNKSAYLELPFQEKRLYETKIGDDSFRNFFIDEIVWGKKKIRGKNTDVVVGFKGRFSKKLDLGIVPLGADRLIPEKHYLGEEVVCDNCGELID